MDSSLLTILEKNLGYNLLVFKTLIENPWSKFDFCLKLTKVKAMSSSETRKRVVNLKTRCLPEEAEEIRNKAMDSGVTVSEFLRCAAVGRKTRSTIDSQVINELRRLGGLQKHLFNEGNGIHSKEFADILAAIKDAIIRIES